MLTRSQIQSRKSTFPFLCLPAELRNRIYHYALNLRGIYIVMRKHFIRYHDDLGPSCQQYIQKQCPGILLLNRQVHKEARHVLIESDLTIFALFPEDINLVISPTLLQSIRTIHLVLESDRVEICDIVLMHFFVTLNYLESLRKSYRNPLFMVKLDIPCLKLAECLCVFIDNRESLVLDQHIKTHVGYLDILH